ncbi:hypothetical protein FH972_025468 [Carpinus fangiana]|uniref:GH16 domain-containing protein n=1 Tax=Carpinus fangiana TaxID=176857 RepID=A0A5N6L1D1_9ROSI|nr:hypothetical protein FH972_025468 [Carpinus fangiana]
MSADIAYTDQSALRQDRLEHRSVLVRIGFVALIYVHFIPDFDDRASRLCECALDKNRMEKPQLHRFKDNVRLARGKRGRLAAQRDSVADEATSLLRERPSKDSGSPRIAHAKRATWLLIGVIFLVEIGDYLQRAPWLRLLESIICRRYFKEHDPTVFVGTDVPEARCKQVKAVQDELANLIGVDILLSYIPSQWSCSHSVVVPRSNNDSLSGRRLQVGALPVSTITKCLQGRSGRLADQGKIDVRWFLAGNAFLFVGGGSGVISSAIMTMIADVTPVEGRSQKFLLVSASALISAVVSVPLAARMMRQSLWNPMLLGTAAIVVGSSLIAFIPETLQRSADSLDEVEPAPQTQSSEFLESKEPWWKRWARSSVVLTSPALIAFSATFLVQSLGRNTMRFILPLASTRFAWTIAESSLILPISAVATLILLVAILPPVNKYLIQPCGFSVESANLSVARGSIVLLISGLVGIALSANVPTLLVAIVIYSFGAGLPAAIRTVASTFVPSDAIATLFAIFQTVDTIGSIASGPVLARAYVLGSGWGGVWSGLPFLLAGVLYGGVAILVYLTRLPESKVDIGRRYQQNDWLWRDPCQPPILATGGLISSQGAAGTRVRACVHPLLCHRLIPSVAVQSLPPRACGSHSLQALPLAASIQPQSFLSTTLRPCAPNTLLSHTRAQQLRKIRTIMKSFTAALASSLFVALASAQTWTACNPMNGTCPPNPALGTSHTFNLTDKPAGKVWNATAGSVDYSQPSGGQFTINQKGDSPTIQSEFYIFFGEVHVTMKAAKGQGIISSIVLESDDLDEVDWEITGTNNTVLLGQPTTTVETNYFGKGNTTAYDRAVYHPVNAPCDTFHKYSVVWTKDKIEWLIDDNLVRTLPYAAANGGNNFPQTPMNVRLGIWAGGDTSNQKGVIEWAGGKTDFDQGPFTMTISAVEVKDYSTGSKEYTYGDTSGSWQSIKATAGNSTAAVEVNKAPSPSMSERWANLSSGARGGIIGGICAGVGILLALFALAVWKRRRAGNKEAAVAERKFDQENLDMIQQQQQWKEQHKAVYADNNNAYSQESVGQNTQYNTRGQPINSQSQVPLMRQSSYNAQSPTSFSAPSPGSYNAPSVRSYNNPNSNPGFNAGQGGGFKGGMYNNGFGGGGQGGSAGGYYNGHY